MLQLLYPCNQYCADKCLLCGGTFRDHLTLWWAKNLYTPYDLYLDHVYKDGVVQTMAEDDSCTKTTKIYSKTSSKIPNAVDFCYHRRYVLDVPHFLKGVKRQGDKTRILHREISQRYQHVLGSKAVDKMEQRRSVPGGTMSKQQPIKYIIPRAHFDADFLRKTGPTKVAIWLFAREQCLDAVDKLLDIEASDEERSKRSSLP